MPRSGSPTAPPGRLSSLINLADTASPTNTHLYGFQTGGTFTYNPGTGSVEISDDAGGPNTSTAVLQFGAGITAAQINASIDGSGNLYVTDGISGDQIRIDSMMRVGWNGQPEYGVAQIRFADGTAWSAQQLINLADTASPTNTYLYGFQTGGTFTYSPGTGSVEISDDAGGPNTSTAVLQFGAGITAAQINASIDGSGNLYVTDGISGDQIRIDSMMRVGWNGQPEYGVAQIRFADGTAWSAQQSTSWRPGGPQVLTR